MKIHTMPIFLAFTLTACASSRKLDQEVKKQPAVETRSALADEFKTLVQNSPNLKPEQKQALLQLRDFTRQQSDQLRQQSLKLRAVLIQDVLATRYNEKEVNLLKRRIAKVNRQRTNLLFDTVDRANNILGRGVDYDKNQLMEGLLRPDLQRGDF